MIGYKEDTTRQAELDKMKFRATALFWLMAALFVLAAIFERKYPGLSFVRATAEAAMVGAIADWFAVTALFRHPFGLKIPHTAIIPHRKDSIARQFGQFVQNNFLAEEIISDKLRSMDIGRSVARWISRPENSAQITNHVTVGLAAMVQVVKDEDVQHLIEQGVIDRIRSTQFAPFVASVLTLVTSGNRHQDLLYGTLKLVGHLLQENETALRQKINRETPWWVPKAVDHAIYHKIVEIVDKTCNQVRTNPNHPLHAKFSEVVEQFVENLKHSPDITAQEQALKEELLQHPVVQEFSLSLWLDFKDSLLNRDANPESNLRAPIQEGIKKFGEALLNDAVFLAKINRWVEEIARYLIREYGHEGGQLVTYTIDRWDAEATSHKIELHIGKDLQFIRINGTLVGGLVGLLIHTISTFL